MIDILLRDIDHQLLKLKSAIESEIPPAFFQKISFATHNDSKFIPSQVIENLSGRKAISSPASTYARLIRQKGQEPLSVLRACGIVSAKPEMCSLVQHINAMKNEANQLLTTLPKHEYDKVKKRFHPSLILNQLYPHISVTDQPVDPVCCSWIYSSKSSAQVTKGDLIEQLVRLKGGRRDAGKDIKFIKHDLEKIISFPTQHHFKNNSENSPSPKI